MEFLASSAKELGDYIIDREYEFLLEQFIQDRPADYTEFMNWVRGYMYYHAVYCVCGGVVEDVVEYLKDTYEQLIHDDYDEDEVNDMMEERIVEDVAEYLKTTHYDKLQDVNDEDKQLEANRQSIERTLKWGEEVE